MTEEGDFNQSAQRYRKWFQDQPATPDHPFFKEENYNPKKPIINVKAVLKDKNGNTVKCKCGKESGSALIGKESFIVWCEDCSPYANYPEAEFVYKPPEENYE